MRTRRSSPSTSRSNPGSAANGSRHFGTAFAWWAGMLWWQRRCSLHRLRRACRRREASLHASATPAIIFALHDRFERAFADGARSADAGEVNALLDRYAGILIARQAIVHAIRDAKGGRAAAPELLALRC